MYQYLRRLRGRLLADSARIWRLTKIFGTQKRNCRAQGNDSAGQGVDEKHSNKPILAMLSTDEAEDLLRCFPSVEFAFAYGSGVVEQGGYKYEQSDPSKLPMMDFILVVENSEQWHEDNMFQNPSHYTSIIPLGSKYVAQFQDKIPAHLWFNAYIPMKSKGCVGRLMKYGVISKEYMLEDLNTWSNLYTAGRLQKPVRVLKHNALIEEAIKNNLESAVRTSLLMLPDKFEEIDLYLNIASLSYVGDPRMYFGENPKKVLNLVTPIVPHYQQLYKSAVDSLSSSAHLTKVPVVPNISTSTNASSGVPTSSFKSTTTFSFEQSKSAASRWDLCLGLPSTIRKILAIKKREQYLKSKPPNSNAVRTAVSSIVARAASMQTVKGLFTVGLVKGGSYLAAKLGKRFLSPN